MKCNEEIETMDRDYKREYENVVYQLQKTKGELELYKEALLNICRKV